MSKTKRYLKYWRWKVKQKRRAILATFRNAPPGTKFYAHARYKEPEKPPEPPPGGAIGFNYVPSGYVIGVDCYFKNQVPVNEKYWRYFKDLRQSVTYHTYDGRKYVISEDMVQATFNPVLHMLTNAVIRDSFFQFAAYCRSHGLDIMHDWQNRQFFINLTKKQV